MRERGGGANIVNKALCWAGYWAGKLYKCQRTERRGGGGEKVIFFDAPG